MIVFREALRHALALDPPEPDPDLDAWIERLADEIVQRRMGPALLLFLGSSVPAAFAFSQLLVFAEPVVQSLFALRSYPRLVAMLEDRERVEQLMKAVERKIEERRARR